MQMHRTDARTVIIAALVFALLIAAFFVLVQRKVGPAPLPEPVTLVR
jgi:hypothetical protein